MPDRFVMGAPLGRWQTNCYLVGDREIGVAVVVDPGEHGAEQVPALLEAAGVGCAAIALTHGHLDHLWAVPELARSLDVPVLLHPGDRWLWDDPAAAFGAPPELLEQTFGLRWDPPTDHLREVEGDSTLELAGVRFDVVHNPGHTPGHVTYLARELAGAPVTFALGEAEQASDAVLFSGDLVFAGSIGRTDFPRGSTADIHRSLVATLTPLEGDTLILSGHGPDTRVARELTTNPFVREALASHRPG